MSPSLLLLARTPTLLYRIRLGWLLGRRFLLLHHAGRRTGRPHATVLEVVARDEVTNSFYVAAGFGEHSEWLRNLQVQPRVHIEVGLHRWEAVAEMLPPEESKAVLATYAQEHPLALWLLSGLFGFRNSTPGDLARSIPIVRLRTTQPLPDEVVRGQLLANAGTATVAVNLSQRVCL